MKIAGVVAASFLLAQYALEVDSADTGEPSTLIDLFVGAGSYADVRRDCNGRIIDIQHVRYSEGGVAVTHDISAVRLRVSGGFTRAPQTVATLTAGDEHAFAAESIPYLAPSVGLNTEYVGIDAGYVFLGGQTILLPEGMTFEPGGPSSGRPQDGNWTGRIRVGREAGTYFSAGFGNNVPLSIGTGLFDAGVGFSPGLSGRRYWLGLGLIPDDGLMWGGRAEFPLSRRVAIGVAGHLAPSAPSQFGLAGGLRLRF
jgi:hypothetical protein